MKKMEYLESIGFVDVTEQVLNEIKSNSKITKAMEYVLQQVEYYELKFVVHPKYIGEKNVIFFQKYKANFKYICEVVNNKTSFTTSLPAKIQAAAEKIKVGICSVLYLNLNCYTLANILDAFEFFQTGNPELPHHTVESTYANGSKCAYENYPCIYWQRYIDCEY